MRRIFGVRVKNPTRRKRLSDFRLASRVEGMLNLVWSETLANVWDAALPQLVTIEIYINYNILYHYKHGLST